MLLWTTKRSFASESINLPRRGASRSGYGANGKSEGLGHFQISIKFVKRLDAPGTGTARPAGDRSCRRKGQALRRTNAGLKSSGERRGTSEKFAHVMKPFESEGSREPNDGRRGHRAGAGDAAHSAKRDIEGPFDRIGRGGRQARCALGSTNVQTIAKLAHVAGRRWGGWSSLQAVDFLPVRRERARGP